MATIFNTRFAKFFVLGMFMLPCQISFGQLLSGNELHFTFSDSSRLSRQDVIAAELPRSDESLKPMLKTLKGRKALMSYLKEMNSLESVQYNKSNARFYYRLATTFARLRMYPLAMKCFLKTMQISSAKHRKHQKLQAEPDSLQLDTSVLAINGRDDSVVNSRPNVFENGAGDSVSKPIATNRIAETFNDGKKAAGYAILVHVKQPVPGKRKIFSGTNVGHTFITLIKYNNDSSYVSLSFGFYPRKQNILSGTPLEPSTPSVFKNDSEHQWDEVLGKFISKRRFERILALSSKYSAMEYHLSKNNCTDFGISAAKIAGIEILETSGSWPLGSGNNPGVAGQSILQGKYKDADQDSPNSLFVESTIAKP